MKLKVIGLSVLMLAVCAGAVEYRSFTDRQGRSITARLMEVDAAGGRVRIEREDGKRVWVQPDLFSESDQSYIREWSDAQDVLSEKSLKVSIELFTEPTDADTVYDSNKDKRLLKLDGQRLWGVAASNACFKVILENRSSQDLEGLTIEYRYYIDGTGFYRIPGTLEVDALAAGERKALIPEKVVLVKHFHIETMMTRESQYDAFQTRSVEKSRGTDRLAGVWVRIYGPSVDGVPSFRDVVSSEDLDTLCMWDEWSATNVIQSLIGPETLEAYQARGTARSPKQYKEWTGYLFMKRIGSGSRDEMNLHQEGFRIFYDPALDPEGYSAHWMAGECDRHALYPATVYWLEIAAPLMAAGERHNQNESRILHIYERMVELYASSSDPGIHDGARAVEYANLLLAKDRKSDRYLDLLARSYARNGQFDQAVKAQEQAIERLAKGRKDEKDLMAYRNRLELYRTGQAYTDSGE